MKERDPVNKRMRAVFWACLFLIPACSVGRDFVFTRIAEIREGVTTKRDLLVRLGDPYQKGLDGGLESWRYFYATKAGMRDRSKELYILFDKDGTVKSYTFSTNFPGEELPAEGARPKP